MHVDLALRRKYLIPAWICFLLLAGCATKEPPETDEVVAQAMPETTAVPGKWAAAAEAGAVPDGWLKTFEDPEMEALVASPHRARRSGFSSPWSCSSARRAATRSWARTELRASQGLATAFGRVGQEFTASGPLGWSRHPGIPARSQGWGRTKG